MHRAIPLAATVSCLTLLAPSAQAAEIVGFTCGYTSTGDPTGVAEPDADVQYGEIDGGPVAVVAAPGESPVLSVTVICSLQLNSADPATPDLASASVTASGSVGVVPPSMIAYRANLWDWVSLCTRVEWVTRDGRFGWDYDADDTSPGPQCAYPVSLSESG